MLSYATGLLFGQSPANTLYGSVLGKSGPAVIEVWLPAGVGGNCSVPFPIRLPCETESWGQDAVLVTP